MTWIRVESGIGDSVKVVGFAKELKLTVAGAVGHLVLFWGQVADHASNGDITQLPDDMLERWAQWFGKRGKFAPAFRRVFAPNGRIHDWDTHQGKLIERRVRERDRLREKRATDPPVLQQQSANRPATPRQRLRATVRNNNDTIPPPAADAAGSPGGTASSPPAIPVEFVQRFPTAYRDAVTGALLASHDPHALYTELEAQLSGLHGPGGKAVPADVLGRAVHEIQVAGEGLTARRLRVFVADLLRVPPAEPAASGERDEFEEARRALRRKEPAGA